ncbi:DUF2207 domain-containing protein [Fusobacterium sp.]|uniref:DUF2207 family protein n=1 Tax=Fusobacterium sp. TaxID=68766 RepID=UPI0025C0A4EA|nr:DUF2207 domain-containing protein [Fusobacterium sp.]
MGKFKTYLNKLLPILFTFALLSLYTLASPKYSVVNLNIEAKINRDGSVNITELVEYNSYNINGILYNIDYSGYGELKDLQVFYEQNSEFYPAKNSNSHNKGTYTLNNSDELMKIKLYYPMRNQNKWFLFNYTLTQGVTVYNDIAQFNRKMVGKSWKSNIDNIKVKITLPEKVPTNKIKAFGHGPLIGDVDIINGKEILYTLHNYYSGEFVETNVLFPRDILSNIDPSIIKNEDGYDKILKLENKLADRADLHRKILEMKDMIGALIFAIFLAWIAFILLFNYIQNIRKHKVNIEHREYFKEAPNNFSPAVGGAIACGGILPNHLLATVIDLVRRDYLEISVGEESILRKKNLDLKDLKDYEKFVIEWYIDELGDGSQISMEEIERVIKDRKSAINFGQKYEKWQSMVVSDLKNVGFKREKKNKLPIALAILTAVLGLPTGVFLSAYFNDGKFISFPFISFFLIMFSTSGRRYTLEAENLRAEWLDYKKFLIDYRNFKEAKLSPIYIWEQHFTYAIALGVAEEVAKGYSEIYVENNDIDRRRFNRIPLIGMYGRNSRFRNIERTISNSVIHSTRALSNSRPSSRGSGGGFSGGSSGGGGSRGGGGAF